MVKFIVTVPHIRCPFGVGKKSHLCDGYSGIAADAMMEVFKEYAPGSVLIEAQQPRSVVDMNRIQGYDMPERRALRQIVERRDDDVVVFDVHSFHKEANWPDKDIVLLDFVPSQQFTKDVIRYFNAQPHGPSMKMLEGTLENDIIREMAPPKTLTAVLVEYNEERSVSHTVETAKLFAIYAVKYFIK